jgi:hypothetical protein
MTSHEGTSATKPPLFDGTIFSFWKVRMRTYLMALGVDVWDVVETGYINPIVLASKDKGGPPTSQGHNSLTMRIYVAFHISPEMT